MRKTLKTLILCGTPAMLLATLTTAPPQAAPTQDEPVVIRGRVEIGQAVERVSFADLNLASARDQARLHRRISNASHRVCTPQALGVSVSDEDFVDCSRGARRLVKPDVDLAIERARQLAATGTSDIPAVALSVATAL